MGACISEQQPHVALHKCIEKELNQSRNKDHCTRKLLILGIPKSGKSTFFNQLNTLCHGNFDDKYRLQIKSKIFLYIIRNIKDITKYINENPDIYTINKDDEQINNCFANIYDFNVDYLIQNPIEINNILNINDILQDIVMIYKQKYIQQLCQGTLKYFLCKLQIIIDENYVVTDQDIVYFKKTQNAINELKFIWKSNPFQILNLNRNYNTKYEKWLDQFEYITVLIFIVSLSCYDENDIDGKNTMTTQIDYFGEIINSKWFKETGVILMFTKSDLFKHKVSNDDDDDDFLNCFQDYKAQERDNDDEEEKYGLIRNKYGYKDKIEYINSRIKQKNEYPQRKIFSHVVDEITKKKMINVICHDTESIIIDNSLMVGGLVADSHGSDNTDSRELWCTDNYYNVS